MKEIVVKNKCTGCTACLNICPRKAITMKENQDGFKYPCIDQEKCINCGLCNRICPVLNTRSNISLNISYAAYAIDNKIMEKTSSGGLFPLIANKILDENGIVIGAAFDNDNKLNHIAITKKEDLESLKGSKYLQSDLNNIFSFINENVKNKKILFVGTPCQVAGLNSFIKNKENLFCVDLICHGVPSPKLFDKYITELEKENNDKVVNYNFRDKITGWDNYSNTIEYKNKTITQMADKNDYMKLFLSDVALRESCFNCNFKLGNKYSDITLGDFWGVQKYYPEMYNKKGVSAIVINTEKGLKMLNSIKDKLIFKECAMEEIIVGNPCLKYSSKIPKKRKSFLKVANKYNISTLAKKYRKKEKLSRRIKNKIKKGLSMIYKS